MTSYPQLSHPPIREGLIDIQFENEISKEFVDRHNVIASKEYEKSTPIWHAIFNFSPEKITKDQVSNSTVGYRYDNSSPPNVLQCRTKGFTFSRLTPYSNWDDLSLNAKKAWNSFTCNSQEIVVNRIAVRFINQIELNLPISDFNEFLRCSPDIPEQLNTGLSAFLQRVVIPVPENNCIAIVIQALDEPTIEPITSLKILLDIDVFKTVKIDSKNTELIWQELEKLRNIKNRIFFSFITEKLIERYK